MDNKLKYQYEGIKWLAEMELLNHPQLINTIKFNILTASPRIKEVELLVHREHKAMLVLLELTWFGRRFSKKNIFEDVQDVLVQLLPSFQFRITDDPRIMELAIEHVKRALTGGKHENISNSGDAALQPTAPPEVQSSVPEQAPTRSQESVEPNSKEQSVIEQGVFSSVGSDYSTEE